MSWLARLYETYEAVATNDQLNESLEPYFHKHEQCHIEVVIDGEGNFVRAQSLVTKVTYGKKSYWKGEETLIPITPKSLTGRTSGSAPYPLIEKIQYVAKDYPDYGGSKSSYFDDYFKLLSEWVASKHSHPKIEAVAKYIAKGTVVRDLVAANILFVAFDEDGREVLIKNWSKQGHVDEKTRKKLPKPPLLNAVNSNEQGNATIRWRVQRRDDPDDKTWNDPALIRNWIEFQKERNQANGFCQILGEKSFIARTHPKGIVKKVNDAKLISVPTEKGYLTFQGRFIEADQACTISFEASQKAHNALRWLISRGQGFQAYPKSEQIFVTWALSGKPVIEPLEDIFAVMSREIVIQPENPASNITAIDHSIDAGQSFASNLKKYLKGYLAELKPTESIVVLGMDAVTKGRLGVTYYQKLLASEFFERVERWHNQFAWPQRHTVKAGNSAEGKFLPVWCVCSPSPKRIMQAAYGDILKSNEKLAKQFLQRILSCIIEGTPFPKDIMLSSVRRASNRAAKRLPDKFSNYKSELAEWEKHLGVACALYKGFHMRHPDNRLRREYVMTLEEERTTRDYLFGRLLAVAERIEEVALRVGDENRPTTAARLMQRFADRPSSTWRNIEMALQPYMQRLQQSRAGFLTNRKKELDAVISAFDATDFTDDKPLRGEFLLGYHCQRLAYRSNKDETTQGNE